MTTQHIDSPSISGNVPLSVAVVIPTMPQENGAGGVTSAHYNIYRSLHSLGCNTRLFSFEDYKYTSGVPGAFRYGASTRVKSFLAFVVFCYLKTLGSVKPAYQLADIIYSIPGSLHIRRHLKRLRPDVTIIPDHGAPGLFLSNRQTQIILVVHHLPARFVSSPLLGDYCKIDIAKATVLEQRVLKYVDAVVCPSEYMKNIFQQTYSFDGEIAVIPNLVDEQMMDSVPLRDIRTELGLSHVTPVVYIPSAGSSLKGSRYIFEIVRRLAKACNGPIAFYLSGTIDPTLKEELCHVPGNAFLFMPGYVNLQTNISYVKSCSFGVSPTLIESFGMAILEAGFCNVPMVAFEVGGTGEVICSGKNGYLVPFLDLEGLVTIATKLLDAEFCAMVRQSTGKYVRERFNSHRIAEEYLALCIKTSKSELSKS